jgi:hypothetical protein
VGFRVGLDLAKWHYDDSAYETKMNNGLIVSVPFEFRPGKHFAVQPEIGFVQKGCKVTSPDGTYGSTVKLHYIEVPVMLKLMFGHLALIGGPQAAIALGGSYKTYGQNVPGQSRNISFESDGVSRIEFSAALGISLREPTKKGAVFLDGRYVYGLSDLSNEKPSVIKVSSRCIYITAGYLFLLGSGKKNAETPTTK